MSEENVEIVQEMWDTMARDDPTIIPVSFIDPAVIYEDEFIPDHAGETYRGQTECNGPGRRRSKHLTKTSPLTIPSSGLGTSAMRSLPATTSGAEGKAVASRSSSITHTSGGFEKVGSSTASPSGMLKAPSKPPGCRSRDVGGERQRDAQGLRSDGSGRLLGCRRGVRP